MRKRRAIEGRRRNRVERERDREGERERHGERQRKKRGGGGSCGEIKWTVLFRLQRLSRADL